MRISELSEADVLVLDTHVWAWASGEAGGPEQLRPDALPSIELAARSRRLFVSAASVWEIALKYERGRVRVLGDLHRWVRDQRRYPGVRVLPIDSRLGIECTRLPRWTRKQDGGEHRDPGDRFIVASARRLNAVILTCDTEILAYSESGHVQAFDCC
jgi:PIN domain nuclease of toxin-antitoxin system